MIMRSPEDIRLKYVAGSSPDDKEDETVIKSPTQDVRVEENEDEISFE